jgi:UDP-2-acetamido-2,6-beta-L-arabino-hexul-4-ose reductase
MRILITGIEGFIGRNLRVRLQESGFTDLSGLTEASTQDELVKAASEAEFVFHLAGVNRPKDPAEFAKGNVSFTETLCRALSASPRPVPVLFASSAQALLDNPYGKSKREAEEVLVRYGRETGAPVHIFRLPNVFGKWCRPNYNSAIATFCHNIARGLPITLHDPSAPLRLVYIDDVVSAFLGILQSPSAAGGFHDIDPVYETTVGEASEIIRSFPESRTTLLTDRVGTGLRRALHATYLSHLPTETFAYTVPQYRDPRGEFVELLKTPDCGQFSYFTAAPGITRGEHYHHTKTEKFLVIRGTARYQFRHIDTQERHELVCRGGEGHVVETVPGWTHNITNIGEDELIVMLWANEVFNRSRPDTTALRVEP